MEMDRLNFLKNRQDNINHREQLVQKCKFFYVAALELKKQIHEQEVLKILEVEKKNEEYRKIQEDNLQQEKKEK